MFSQEDLSFMKEAISLAESAKVRTTPDPMVGAVIVKNGKILSTGFHAEVGTPHAEAWAIQKAKDEARGATLYVNLEPCCFFKEKNNPPCTELIIKSGIKRVVAAMEDPNPSISGRGLQELKDAGIEVVVGVMEEEAKKLNEIFVKYISTGRPFVTLKTAMSLDGKIATKTGESFWITGIEARQYAHHLRNFSDAILVGVGTVLKDDPTLNVRGIKDFIKNPKKIILDPNGKTPLKSKALAINPENTIIVTSPKCPKKKAEAFKKAGAEIIYSKTKNGEMDLDSLMKELGKAKITSILIEGGGKTNALALSSGTVDKIYFFVSPKIIGGKEAPTPVEGEGESFLSKATKLKDFTYEKIGEDILIKAYILK